MCRGTNACFSSAMTTRVPSEANARRHHDASVNTSDATSSAAVSCIAGINAVGVDSHSRELASRVAIGGFQVGARRVGELHPSKEESWVDPKFERS